MRDGTSYGLIDTSELEETGISPELLAMIKDVKPVAWRWRRNRWPNGDWVLSGVNPSDHIVHQDTDPVTIEPLYAALSALEER